MRKALLERAARVCGKATGKRFPMHDPFPAFQAVGRAGRFKRRSRGTDGAQEGGYAT
jgi:hypothetical protein